jgi:hypothetical protein
MDISAMLVIIDVNSSKHWHIEILWKVVKTFFVWPVLQVALDIDYHHNMLISQQKVNPKEVIVGW